MEIRMGQTKDMALAFQKLLSPSTVPRTPPDQGESPNRLNVAVVFTSQHHTIAALRKAGALANRLNARLVLLAPQEVPLPLPIESPPVLLEFSERRFAEIIKEAPVEAIVQIYLCRNRLDTLLAVLKPHSLVVIGGQKRWWPTAEKSLARCLRRAGHEVIVTEAE